MPVVTFAHVCECHQAENIPARTPHPGRQAQEGRQDSKHGTRHKDDRQLMVQLEILHHQVRPYAHHRHASHPQERDGSILHRHLRQPYLPVHSTPQQHPGSGFRLPSKPGPLKPVLILLPQPLRLAIVVWGKYDFIVQ
jgi:hypothetical protein